MVVIGFARLLIQFSLTPAIRIINSNFKDGKLLSSKTNMQMAQKILNEFQFRKCSNFKFSLMNEKVYLLTKFFSSWISFMKKWSIKNIFKIQRGLT